MTQEPLTIAAGDTAWMLTSTALVLLMVPGLSLFYGGLVRGRAVLNTMLMRPAHPGLARLSGLACAAWVRHPTAHTAR
jgi:ammonia channel protein AmtB